MANPLTQFAKQYFKLPDAYYGLGVLAGFIFVDSLLMDRVVKKHIFGRDGKGGKVLECYSRIDPHEAEYREHRKKWYWHQRRAKFFMPQDFNLNDKLDYKTLTYNYSHINQYLKPRSIEGHHSPEGYYFNDLEPEDLMG